MKFKLNNHIPFTKFMMKNATLAFLAWMVVSCNQNKVSPPGRSFVETPQQMDEKVPELIKQYIDYAMANNGRLNDSVQFSQPGVVQFLYSSKNFSALWSKEEKFTATADSLLHFIRGSMLYCLFSADYN